MYIFVSMCSDLNTNTNRSVYVYTYVNTCMYTYIYICIFICIYVCIYIYMHVYIYAYIYIYIWRLRVKVSLLALAQKSAKANWPCCPAEDGGATQWKGIGVNALGELGTLDAGVRMLGLGLVLPLWGQVCRYCLLRGLKCIDRTCIRLLGAPVSGVAHSFGPSPCPCALSMTRVSLTASLLCKTCNTVGLRF